MTTFYQYLKHVFETVRAQKDPANAAKLEAAEMLLQNLQTFDAQIQDDSLEDMLIQGVIYFYGIFKYVFNILL